MQFLIIGAGGIGCYCGVQTLSEAKAIEREKGGSKNMGKKHLHCSCCRV